MSGTNSPVTFKQLWTEPLPDLFGRVIADRQAEALYMVRLYRNLWLIARTLGLPLGLRGLARLPGATYVRGRAVVALIIFIRMFDHIIDRGDVHRPVDGREEEYFEQASWVIHTLQCPGLMGDEIAYPVMAGLIYAYRVCTELLGYDPTEQMGYIWELYTPDVERMLAGETFANRTTMEGAYAAYRECVFLALVIMGVPEGDVRKVIDLATPLQYSDTFNDFVYDLIHRNVQIPIETFMEEGIDTQLLLECESWDELAEVPQFAAWFTWFAATQESTWLANRAEAMSLIRPHFSIIGRYVAWRKFRQLGRGLRRGRERFAALFVAEEVPDLE